MTPWARFALLGALLATGPREAEARPEPVKIYPAASRGRIIPQSKGGGGFQRTFRFTAVPGRANHWIRQVLEVRGTVLDARGESTPAHLDVVEYYRVGWSGRAIQADSHYSQYWEHCGGDLTISSTLTYGTLAAGKRGDTILSRSFILKWAKDAAGELVPMRKRTTRELIPAEKGERVHFHLDAGSLPTRYAYRVAWDARPGVGSRTQPSGRIDVGTWRFVVPRQTGYTKARIRPAPIPPLRTGR